MGAGTNRSSRALVDELNRRHGEDIAWHHTRGHTRRNRLCVFGFEVDVDEVRIAVGSRRDAVNHTDEHAVIFNVGLLRQAVADVDEVGHHPDIRIEPTRRLTNNAAVTSATTTSRLTPQPSSWRFDGPRPSGSRELDKVLLYPPNLAPASTDHSAIVSSMLTMITTVMLALIACPAATPTPSGPPDA